MKVIAINGSPRKDGNTATLINHVFETLRAEGIETEVFQLGGKLVHGCTACMQCFEKKNRRCAITNDAINECIEKMEQADGIIIATPTYFTDVTTEIKALIDRAGYVSSANGGMYKRKVGAAVVAVRRAGAVHAFDTINHWFHIMQMIVPGSRYWNLGVGLKKGDVAQDEEGMKTMQVLGENMAWLMKKLAC